MIRKTHAVVFTSIVAATLTTTAAQAAQLDQERRVDAHRAVEQVLWDHRVWPDSNPGPKPPLHSVLPDSALRARVDDVLRKSNALATLWKRPIGNLELQAELDRMVRGSRDPGALGAMFDALGRDPVLVAETIARPALVDRLIRSWYANDPRFHDAERREAERGFAAATTPEDLARIAPLYETTTWTRDDTSTASDGSSPGTISLDAADWNDILERIRQRFARSGAEGVGELPIGRMSPLRETDAAYSATVVLSKSTRTVRVAVASWPKTSFDTWWASERSNQPPILSELRTMEPALVLSREPASPSVPSCADDAWTRTGTGAPEGRYSHTAVWTGSEMIVWGGLAGFYVSFHEANTGGRYAPATDTWSPLSTIGAPTPRIDHVAIWTGSRMVVWGGRQLLSSNVFFDTGGRYDPVTDSWTPTSTVGAPSPRVPLVAVWTGSRTVVWGDAYTFAGATGSGGRYDPVADSWSPTTQVDAPQQDYSSPGAVWTGSQLIVWPGKRYDPVADTWSPIASADAPALRGFHCQVWTGSRMLVWGGNYYSTFMNDGGIYDPSSDSWSAMTTSGAPQARSSASCAWLANRFVVWGGETAEPAPLDTGGRYDPVSNAWSPTTTTGAPFRRSKPTTVATSTEMIIWGGATNSGGENTGGRYNPNSDSWVPTRADAPSPSARYLHSAVWTGAEMILWGGSSDGGLLDDGSLYTPATDNWIDLSHYTMPSPRAAHKAVWTGTAMLVWGGLDGAGYSGTGGRYYPTSYGWLRIANVGAPEARSDHTAVWSGSSMVVWGGLDGFGSFGNGGRYDPVADAWLPISGASAPTPRANHTAVWSGSSMIVWGGAGPGGYQSTGGRYDPTSDVWTATTTTGAPGGRRSHAAVWAGSRMLVWGGYDGSALPTGGSYDPAANAWSAIAAAGAPAARYSASAIWTGAEMIVWGGNTGAYVNTGGRYRPDDDSWRPTSLAAAPRVRAFHSAIWTGGKMVIWGGSTSAGCYNDGASYCSCVNWYTDADGDGYGTAGGVNSVCDGTHPAGYAYRPGDCNDGNPSVRPGALDNTCNGVDEDCNGAADDLWIGGLSQCGLGVCRETGYFECLSGQLINNCTTNPPNSPTDESCNALDDDCDGAVDEDFVQDDDYWTATYPSYPGRSNPASVWTGTELIVFGGDDGFNTPQAGGNAYTPASDTWRSLASGPSTRRNTTAVWTGSKMIVWGGDDGLFFSFNDGGRYDPATNSWGATATFSAPSNRSEHTAVWTGSRMVIWGGKSGPFGSFLATGAQYDPVGDTWSATTTTNAPAARYAHSAVWTGTQMIVWGGLPSGLPVNTGSRYDPSANTWSAVSTTGAPSARYGHVAMWTGSAMIVWGGLSDAYTPLGDGARYNPATDSWTPISSLGAPPSRGFASAVWTGTELIVWSGASPTVQNPNTLALDGARYNLATDSWSPPMSNQLIPPLPRTKAAAAWTGTELIVWGGSHYGHAEPSGGRYSVRTLCGVGGCQQVGVTYCIGGLSGFQCTPQTPTSEVCDNVDNDCDTMVDEGIPVPSTRPAVFATKLGPAGSVTYQWAFTPDTTHYDAVRGVLATLRSTSGNFTTSVDACLANNTRGQSMQDDTAPTPGTGYWYLVRPMNLCSGNGTYDDAVPPQQGLRDAEIAGAASACP